MVEFLANNWPYLTEGLALIAGVIGAGHAIMTKRDVRAAASWTAIVLLSPFVGALLYAMFGVNRVRLKKLLRKRKAVSALLVSETGPSRPDAIKT